MYFQNNGNEGAQYYLTDDQNTEINGDENSNNRNNEIPVIQKDSSSKSNNDQLMKNRKASKKCYDKRRAFEIEQGQKLIKLEEEMLKLKQKTDILKGNTENCDIYMKVQIRNLYYNATIRAQDYWNPSIEDEMLFLVRNGPPKFIIPEQRSSDHAKSEKDYNVAYIKLEEVEKIEMTKKNCNWCNNNPKKSCTEHPVQNTIGSQKSRATHKKLIASLIVEINKKEIAKLEQQCEYDFYYDHIKKLYDVFLFMKDKCGVQFNNAEVVDFFSLFGFNEFLLKES